MEIQALNKYDTRAVVKITDWKGDVVLEALNQKSTVDGEWFTREVLIGGKLHDTLEGFSSLGYLELEVVTSYHNPSEKARQIQKELDRA